VRLYERFVLPRIVHFVCGQRPAMRQRGKIVPLASGDVAEIGFGSGHNLPFYDPSAVRKVWAVEPSAEMWELAEPAVAGSSLEVEHLRAPAEEIPLPDRSVDTVLLTYTLCTLPDAPAALHEMRRILRAGGRLIFCEHGEAPDESVRRWQRRINPIWRRLAGGCNLDRPIPSLIRGGEFEIERLDTLYLPGWKFANYNYWGSAVAR